MCFKASGSSFWGLYALSGTCTPKVRESGCIEVSGEGEIRY